MIILISFVILGKVSHHTLICLIGARFTRVTTHYFITHFELLSTHFKLCTTHSKFFETHFQFTTNSEIFATHFKIFATHFEIFTTHFEIFATHSPQDLKCWQRKRKRLRSSFPFLRRHVLFHVWRVFASLVQILP